MLTDSYAVLYFAIGVFDRKQRKLRDKELLETAAADRDVNIAPRDFPCVKVGPPHSVPIFTNTLVTGIRRVTDTDGDASIELHHFPLGWPGRSKSNKALSPAPAFRQWLKSSAGRELFEKANAVTLYAFDMRTTQQLAFELAEQ